MPTPLTWLYVPADDPVAMREALDSGADAVVYDLEDTVLHARRDAARELLRGHLTELADVQRSSWPQIVVRINALGSAWGADDVAAIRGLASVEGVRVPKVAGAADVEAVDAAFDGTPPALYPLLESAAAIEEVSAIARHPAVAGLVIGEQDLRVELGIPDESGFAWIRSRVVVAARAAGLPAPPLNVYPATADDEGLAVSCRAGARLGMFGRSALHARQLPVIRAAFTPSDEEVAAAEELVVTAEAAAREGRGAAVLDDGRFVDEPIVEAARRTLALHSRLTGATAR